MGNSNKHNKIKKHNKTKKRQTGGIFLTKPAEDAFQLFIRNCSVELLSHNGEFGIILKLNLNNDVESPYTQLNSMYFKQPVKSILVKLVALGNTEEIQNIKTKRQARWYYNTKREYHRHKIIDTEETFIKEVNTQTDIFFKTMQYLEPLCPAPVYAKIFKDKDASQEFIELLEKHVLHSEPDLIDILKYIKEDIKTIKIPRLGVFGMEIASGSITLSQLKRQPESEYYSWVEQAAKLQILKLAIETGYAHNDFHLNNLLINRSYKGIYHKINDFGKVVIIDFGLSSKLSPENINTIKELYSKNEFMEALKILGNITRPDGVLMNKHPQYNWLYITPGQEEYKFNNVTMLTLKTREEIAIDNRIITYNEKHEKEPNVYPLLPLSKSVKNKLFQGIIDDDYSSKSHKSKSLKSKSHKSRSNTKPHIIIDSVNQNEPK
jgi:hypothetical protein